MYKYTICFIQQADQILMLNREKPSWMGSWNGVGGKIEFGESPEEGILREIKEETGLEINQVNYRGVVTWYEDEKDMGGMYAFTAKITDDLIYETPIKTSEGILDWKKREWLCHPENSGVAENLPYFLPTLLKEGERYEFRCYFQDHKLKEVKTYPISEKDRESHLHKKIVLRT